MAAHVTGSKEQGLRGDRERNPEAWSLAAALPPPALAFDRFEALGVGQVGVGQLFRRLGNRAVELRQNDPAAGEGDACSQRRQTQAGKPRVGR